jgi:hypothetical protein
MKGLLSIWAAVSFAVGAWGQGLISLGNSLNSDPGPFATSGGLFFIETAAGLPVLTHGDFNAAFYGGTDSANLTLIQSFSGSAANGSGGAGDGIWLDPTGKTYAISGGTGSAFFRIQAWTGNYDSFAAALKALTSDTNVYLAQSAIFANPLAIPPDPPPELSQMPAVILRTWLNLDFEKSTMLSTNGAGSGVVNVPGWTAYGGYFYSNYSGGTTLIYNDQPLDCSGVCLEGTDYELPSAQAFQGHYSVLLLGGKVDACGNGAAIGQTGQIPATVRSLIYWGQSWNSLQITFNGQALCFVPVGSGPNYTIFQADISAYSGLTGELLFAAPTGGSGMIDYIQFSSARLLTKLTMIRAGRNLMLSWPTSLTGFILQSTTNLSSPIVWTPVPAAPVLVDGVYTVTIPVWATQQFYRLSR